MRIIILSFIVIIILSCNSSDKNINPVNKNANASTIQLLEYLYALRGEKILSGQHNYGHELRRSTDSIVAFTEKYPAIYGSDFVSGNRDTALQEFIRRHKSGSILTLMWHQPRPYADSTGHFRNSISPAEWKQLITPGTPIHQTWLEEIDKVAFYLKELEKEDIPVLWRPYHEMNGNWFWWGQMPGPDGIQKLWKLMYDRYTNYHQLNNLIWVWNANEFRPGEVYGYEEYFPGLEWVDVLATDVYTEFYDEKDYLEMQRLAEGKLIALGEIGEVPDAAKLESQPLWSWFMIWARFPWSRNTPDAIRELYNHPGVITRDEVELKK